MYAELHAQAQMAPLPIPRHPLPDYSIIEAADLDEVIRLVAGTPCARAKGAIEIRPIMAINAINEFLAAWNDNHRPFVWTATVDSIVAKFGKLPPDS
jgi:hypothetical protein